MMDWLNDWGKIAMGLWKRIFRTPFQGSMHETNLPLLFARKKNKLYWDKNDTI